MIKMCVVLLSWKCGKKIPDLHVHFSGWITCNLCVRSGSNACFFFFFLESWKEKSSYMFTFLVDNMQILCEYSVNSA